MHTNRSPHIFEALSLLLSVVTVPLLIFDIGIQKIQEAGGKMVGDKHPEGASGWYHRWEDTEGNVVGIYTLIM